MLITDYVCSVLLNVKPARLINSIVHIYNAKLANKILVFMVESAIEPAAQVLAFQLLTRSAKLALILTA